MGWGWLGLGGGLCGFLLGFCWVYVGLYGFLLKHFFGGPHENQRISKVFGVVLLVRPIFGALEYILVLQSSKRLCLICWLLKSNIQVGFFLDRCLLR